MRALVFPIVLILAACGGAGASVGDFYEDGGGPDVKLGIAPDAGIDATSLVDASPVLEASQDAPAEACVANIVSYPTNVVCGPQGPGTVCQVTGTIYVCREPPGGPGQPPLTDCVLVSRGVDKNTAELVTRTLCPTTTWVPVPDTAGLCIPSVPNLYNGPSTGLPPQGCRSIGGWTIDGVTGTSACCP